MKKISCIVGLFASMAIMNLCMAAEGGLYSSPGSVAFDAVKQKRGEQCIILNRTSPTFERELLAVPRDACVIVIGSWIIKSDFLFKPMEVISPKSESWKVKWRDRSAPVADDRSSWSFKVKTKGLRQVIATINYSW